MSDSVVTYECNNKIQLAVSKCKEDSTKIEASFYTVPHQDLIASLRCHSIDHHIKMLRKPGDANSFSYFQYLTGKMHNCIIDGETKDIMVNWEYGLGYNFNKEFDRNYENALNLNPIPNDWIAFLFNIVLECEKNKNFEKVIGEQKY